MKNVGGKIAKGAAWMVSFKLLERGLGLLSTVVLARLLVPSDFGLVAMAMSIIAILELLNAFGFDMALIQNPQSDRRHYDTAWTFNMLFGLLSAIVLAVLARPAAHFYNEARLEPVIYVLGLTTFIGSLENIGVVRFRKQMAFDKEFKFLISKKLAAVSVTIPLALLLRNYWALVIGMFVGRTAGVMFSYVLQPYRPRISLEARSELFHFSKWLLANGFLFLMRARSADFIIGRLSGPHALGLFNIAFEVSNLPTTELVAPINRAVFPGYAQMSADMDVLRQGFLDVISFIILFSLPIGIGIAAVAPLAVEVFLGPQWTQCIPLIQILAIFGVITAITTNAGYIYLAIGQPRIVTALSAAYVAVLFPLLIVLAARHGAVGAAWAYLIAAGVLLPINYLVILRRLGIGLRRLVSLIWRPIAASLLMLAATIAVTDELSNPPDGHPAILVLAASVLCGAATYCAGIIALWMASSRPAGPERALLDKLMPRAPRLAKLLRYPTP
jgi:lipopolysaccharide exporter